ncbi:sure-like protein [Rhodofomes roseus]|uniref:Sure-like protein n=1 Tax=Rhodofomes roseus TaxID=34475 RepID=A0A4Y9YUQ4_9APHY|nr:sure-like protein [Rhodofomes roseus]KAH9833606.1 sure-like protein [Rhodofomes roseus]TFY65291.1 hypothetical protein EVJ58_g2076 [Rhodofomes roseus]
MFRSSSQAFIALVLLASRFLAVHNAQAQVVISNNDGWATAQIRAQFDALTEKGYDAFLSAPALKQSGKGSYTTTPEVLTEPCQFDTCPVGSPPFGYNASDSRLNYVNAYPANAANYGVNVISPRFTNGHPPDLLVSGPDIGPNVGFLTQYSGTVGAASAASLQNIPAAAFSGVSGAQVSYTTLTSDPYANSTIAARIYSDLTVHFVGTLFEAIDIGLPIILPRAVIVNVNYGSIIGCGRPGDYKWVFARNRKDDSAVDALMCDDYLPTELEVLRSQGCYVSVSALDAETKTDVDAGTQALVMMKLHFLPWSCLE